MMFGIAILLMMASTIAVHLGLPQATEKVASQICKCNKCLSFWVTLGGLLFFGSNITLAILLSLVMSYASNWFSLILIALNNLFDKIWEKLRK